MTAVAHPGARRVALPAPLRTYRWELVRLGTQWRLRIAVGLSVLAPFAAAIVMRNQSTLPTDTLFGRWVHDSGYAVSLVVLGFCGLWALPALTSIVAGDIFAAEDRFGTWKTIVTRSCSRSQIFVGKVAAAMTYVVAVVTILAVSSVAAGLLLVGREPLVGVSGQLIAPERALTLVVASWAIALMPALGFTALGVFFSVATRYAPVGVGLPVVIGLLMQLVGLTQAPVLVRMLLLTTPFTAWRGLFAVEPFHGPVVWAVLVSGGYTVLAIAGAYVLFRRREITGT